ncbi:histidinol-phosphate transaminase [Bacillus sp. NTK071]|uniref:histidinol-phosphate transaminase n=1 Tax=Bacillus sp. NTK071 TaxID=2802175 RepID=UPI001A8EBC07|nr:histidinol-phosphate transaminase [Bacillus sp. NTK071]MBN8207979.1 histidinol-phosphate transaminase [Bacillus sp. NTK071]
MIPKQQLKGLTPYKPGKPIEEVKKELGLKEVVKLASNENPYGSSQAVKEAIQKELTQLNIYPDGYASDLRTAVSEHLNVNEDQIVFGNGSDEVVQMICRTYLEKGTNTVMATPTFPQYRHNAVIEDAEIREVPLQDGKHQLSNMLDEIDENTRVIWVCSPNNPTGEHVPEKDLISFLDQVPKHVLIVVDEAYKEYVTAQDFPDTLAVLNNYNNLVVLRTFSKAYGIAALRVGFGVANSEVVAAIEPSREPFNTSRVAQAAATAALGDQNFIDMCRVENEKGRSLYYEFCEQYDLEVYQSQGNFVLIDFGIPADEVFNYLLKNGYIVRSGSALGFPTSVRITVGSEEQNREIISCLTQLLVERRKVQS